MEGFLKSYGLGQQIGQAKTLQELGQQYKMGAPEERQQILGQIAQYDPQQAQFLQNQQVAQREQQQKNLERMGKFATGVKSGLDKADPKQKNSVYKAYLNLAEQSGMDISDAPEEYSDEAEQYIDAVIGMTQDPTEQISYGKVPEGHYLDKTTGKLQQMAGYKKPLTEFETTLKKEEAKKLSTARSEYRSMKSKLPEVMKTADKLSELGKKASFTLQDRSRDYLLRQMGKSSPGGIARSQYEATVNNQILPLLKDTFGAQFTAQEGESLKATLGDVNKTPEEKDAVLRAFIEQKVASIESKERELRQFAPKKQTGITKDQAREELKRRGLI